MDILRTLDFFFAFGADESSFSEPTKELKEGLFQM